MFVVNAHDMIGRAHCPSFASWMSQPVSYIHHSHPGLVLGADPECRVPRKLLAVTPMKLVVCCLMAQSKYGMLTDQWGCQAVHVFML
jgi:hypothetical protein